MKGRPAPPKGIMVSLEVALPQRRYGLKANGLDTVSGGLLVMG